MRGDVPMMLEAGKMSDYRLWKASHPGAVLNAFRLTDLGGPRRLPSSASSRPIAGG